MNPYYVKGLSPHQLHTWEYDAHPSYAKGSIVTMANLGLLFLRLPNQPCNSQTAIRSARFTCATSTERGKKGNLIYKKEKKIKRGRVEVPTLHSFIDGLLDCMSRECFFESLVGSKIF